MVGTKTKMKKFFGWLVFVYLVIFPFGQLGRIEIAPDVTLHLVDFTAGVIGFLWLIGKILDGGWKLPILARPFLSFLAIAAFSLVLGATKATEGQILTGVLYLLRFLSYILFYFAVWELTRRHREFKTKIAGSLLVVGSAIAVFGWIQYLLLPDIRPLFEYGWDDHYFRLVGTFLDPGFTGILLVFFTLFVFTKVWGRRGEWSNWLLILLGVSSLALTFSRASYLAFMAGLAVLYIVRRNEKLFIGGVLVLILTVFLLPRPGGEGVNLSRTSTIESRIENYKQTFEIGMRNPLFGTGFNLYRYASTSGVESWHAGAGGDSSLLFVFATTGVAGSATYLWLWWKILRFSWKRRNTQAGLILFTSSTSLLIHSLFSNSLFYPWVLGWMAFLLALQDDQGV